MDNFGIKGDEVRHGKQIYLDSVSQASVDSFGEEILSERMLYQLNDGTIPIQQTSARKIAESIKSSDGICFALRLQEDERCIGYAQLGDISWQARHAVLQISILEDTFFTVDMVKDAIQTVLQFVYWEANLNRIEVQCLEDNTVLGDALKNSGFTLEGKLRKEAYRKGHYLDIEIYSILAREWST